MNKSKVLPLVIALLASFSLLFTGCEQGPMEDAGESIDDTVDDATN